MHIREYAQLRSRDKGSTTRCRVQNEESQLTMPKSRRTPTNRKVLCADDAGLENYTADAYASVVRKAIDAESPDLVLFSNTPSGWDMAPKIAAALDAGIVSDVIRIEQDGDEPVFVRRMFNAKFDARLRIAGTPRLATVQPGATEPYAGGEEGSVESFDASGSTSRTRFVEHVRVRAVTHKTAHIKTIAYPLYQGSGVVDNRDVVIFRRQPFGYSETDLTSPANEDFHFNLPLRYSAAYPRRPQDIAQVGLHVV